MMLDDHDVRALGMVSDQRKLEELARADVLCAPSLGGESFGMVLTEAFASATPVLASDIPGYRDVVRDGVDGELVPAGDALALAESLRRLALDPARRERMAGAARERASASPGRTSHTKCTTATSAQSRSPTQPARAPAARSCVAPCAMGCCQPTGCHGCPHSACRRSPRPLRRWSAARDASAPSAA